MKPGTDAGRKALGEARGGACASCGEPYEGTDRFCERCGHPHACRIAVPRPEAGPGRCADCGAGAVGADGYCDQCGLRQPSGREHLEAELKGDAGPPSAAAVTDVGSRRARNEDAFALVALPQAVCGVVCDGVATAPGSEEAAWLAAGTAARVLAGRLAAGMSPHLAMRTAAVLAGEAVASLPGSGAPGDPRGRPACTFVSAIVQDGGVTVGWIGDSRAYWLAGPEGGSRLLTRDDSWAVRMIARGTMSAADAWADRRAHLLTAWLGTGAGLLDPHVTAFRPGGPGLVLICSDGFWNDLPDASAIAAVARTGTNTPAGPDPDMDVGADPFADPLAVARRLVRAALDAGGHDNVTVAAIPFPPHGPDGASTGGTEPSLTEFREPGP